MLSFFRIIIFLVLFNETWDIQLLGWKTKDIILADSWLFISHDFVRTPKDVEEAEDSFTSTISIDISSSINREVPQQQQSINLCCAGDYCFVSNGHEVVCGMTCRRCQQSCHFDCWSPTSTDIKSVPRARNRWLATSRSKNYFHVLCFILSFKQY